MEKVLLCYDGRPDYVILIEDVKHIKDAIEYKNNKVEAGDIGLFDSDFDYIVEYLNNNNIEYDYISLFDAEEFEY